MAWLPRRSLQIPFQNPFQSRLLNLRPALHRLQHLLQNQWPKGVGPSLVPLCAHPRKPHIHQGDERLFLRRPAQ